jgi:hypothetical protein
VSSGRPTRKKVFMWQRTGFNSLNHWFLWIVATKTFLRSQTCDFIHLVGWVSRSPPARVRPAARMSAGWRAGGVAGWGFQ